MLNAVLVAVCIIQLENSSIPESIPFVGKYNRMSVFDSVTIHTRYLLYYVHDSFPPSTYVEPVIMAPVKYFVMRSVHSGLSFNKL